MNKIKIGIKMVGGFVIVAIIAAVVGIVGIANMKEMDKNATNMYENMTVPIGQVVDLVDAFGKIRVALRDELRSDNSAGKKDQQNEIDAEKTTIAKTMDEYAKDFIDDTDKKNFEEFKDALIQYYSELDKIFQLDAAKKMLMHGNMLMKWEGSLAKR